MSKHKNPGKPYLSLCSPDFKKADISDLDRVDDRSPKVAHTQTMNEINREELDVKLQLIEERLDRKVSDIAKEISDLKASNTSTVNALSSAKWWAIGTAIAVLTIFLGTLQWGLSAQKEENARFNSYTREDVKAISSDVKEISKAVLEMRIKMEGSPQRSKE